MRLKVQSQNLKTLVVKANLIRLTRKKHIDRIYVLCAARISPCGALPLPASCPAPPCRARLAAPCRALPPGAAGPCTWGVAPTLRMVV